MYIFNNIKAVKNATGVILHIGKPESFLGKGNNEETSDRERANRVGYNPGTPLNLHPTIVKGQGYTSLLDQRVEKLNTLLASPNAGEVVLADDDIKLRGYGAGMVLLVNNSIVTPQRDISAPGDRLVYDSLSGATSSRTEAVSWLDLMLREAIEEVRIVVNGRLVVYNVMGVDPALAPSITLSEGLALTKAKELGIPYQGTLTVELTYLQPRNAVKVVQELPDGRTYSFYATPLIESKFSGLELVAYASCNSVEENLRFWDSESYAPMKFTHREVHRLFPNGEVDVYHKGDLIRRTTLMEEIKRRDQLRAQQYPEEQKRIPKYNSTIKIDALSKPGALPFVIPEDSPFLQLKFD